MKRKNLIKHLISSGYLSKPEVIDAMLSVERHKFLPENYISEAYSDRPLPVMKGQTISAPHIVAIMSELLDVKLNSKILEIGAGSGYQAAVLAEIAKTGEIYTIERIKNLAEFAERNLKKCRYENVFVIAGDGTLGYEEKAPYDRIIVTAGAPGIPRALVEQLSDKGKMVIPAGRRFYQNLIMIEKNEGRITKKNCGGCVFVPLIGKNGYPD
ncbi:protein-L-isoaspartate O-methyltransferase [Candidatus Altiarchaeales archaeon WOR_SM1_SCG]|nr:protein-L-isoaspartate O-methyltransferase [Candidatus Altiarchaeales archaeon WOR_SM1_SCG]